MMQFPSRGVSRRPMREVQDARKPLYLIFVLDTSASMHEQIGVAKNGETANVRKIDELNRGVACALESMRRFERGNVLYKVYYQIIELNSYGKALFPEFMPLSADAEEVCFEAQGVTCLGNSLSTLQGFLQPKYLPSCNRAVNVILMSDGYPTNVEGYVVPQKVYVEEIERFHAFLEKRGIRSNVDLYAIGIGENACEDMLKTFADADKYYRVEALESLGDKLDFVTRKSLAPHATRSIRRPAQEDRPFSAEEVVGEQPRPRRVDGTLCLNDSCLACVDACALSAIQYENGAVTISPELCVGCGSCESRCPCGAIHVAAGDA